MRAIIGPVRALPGTLALCAVVALAGCSVSVGQDREAVSATRLAAAVDSMLQDAKSEQAEVEDVTCEGELEPEEGAEQRCGFTDRFGDRYGVDVTVTGVDGDELTYDLDPDPGQTVEVEELEPELVSQLSELSGGVPPDAVECPEDLPGREGATVTCVLTAGTDRLETYVTVTSAEGPDVAFDVEVAEEMLP